MDHQFYKNLKEFLKELIAVFPEDDSIKVISSSINLSIMDDDNYSLISMFYKSLNPLEEYIINRDEMFFNIEPGDFWKKGTQQFRLFTKLNECFIQLSGGNKKIIWDYLTVIYGLSKKIYSEII